MSLMSNVPGPGYPSNCVGACPVTKDIAQYNYDTQRADIQRSLERANSDDKPSYIWPALGVAVSAVATFIVARLRKGKA